jgi:peptidoglycan/LPS O-acetylase OafA/YrhL
MVIVSHSWPLGGYGTNPGVGNQLLGDWAVDGFFAISGYLILGSRLNSRSLVDFFWRRILRIWPAFVAALLFVAFVAAPISVFLFHNGRYEIGSAVGYVVRNLGLVIGQLGIDGTLVGQSASGNWNAPLWTLAYEFSCYVGIALIVSVVPRKYLGPSVIVVLFGAMLLGCLHEFAAIPLPASLVELTRLTAFFAAGSAFYYYRARIPMTFVLAAVSAIVSAVLVITQVFNIFGAVSLAYLLMYLGIVLPFARVGSRNDISYGMYIYAFPVQLLLVLAFGERNLPLPVFILLSIVMAIPFAAASWFIIEKPAMSLKRLTSYGKSMRSAKAEAL